MVAMVNGTPSGAVVDITFERRAFVQKSGEVDEFVTLTIHNCGDCPCEIQNAYEFIIGFTDAPTRIIAMWSSLLNPKFTPEQSAGKFVVKVEPGESLLPSETRIIGIHALTTGRAYWDDSVLRFVDNVPEDEYRVMNVRMARTSVTVIYPQVDFGWQVVGAGANECTTRTAHWEFDHGVHTWIRAKGTYRQSQSVPIELLTYDDVLADVHALIAKLSCGETHSPGTMLDSVTALMNSSALKGVEAILADAVNHTGEAQLASLRRLLDELRNRRVTYERTLNVSVVTGKTSNQYHDASTNEISGPMTGQTNTNERQDNCAIDFGIVTAIKVERKAVCAALGLRDEHRQNMGSRVYWRGRLPLKSGEFYEIVVAQSPDMANTDAALLTNDMIRDWHPAAALMVGIAGSADDEVHLGDVVLGAEVYYYERGKETASGLIPEPKMIPADATLWSRLDALPDWDGDMPIARPDGLSKKADVYPGVIASGERVIAAAAVREMIKAGHRKIKAIEMEGYGFSQAARQSFEQVRHVVIRGICDEANENKGKTWHPYAAAAAASYMRHFLLDRPLEPKNRP